MGTIEHAETILNDVKLALRISTSAFDTEVLNLIKAGAYDLMQAGVQTSTDKIDCSDFLIKMAITTYTKFHFGEPDNAQIIKKSYDEQKAQLRTATGYTDWGLFNGQIDQN